MKTKLIAGILLLLGISPLVASMLGRGSLVVVETGSRNIYCGTQGLSSVVGFWQGFPVDELIEGGCSGPTFSRAAKLGPVSILVDLDDYPWDLRFHLAPEGLEIPAPIPFLAYGMPLCIWAFRRRPAAHSVALPLETPAGDL